MCDKEVLKAINYIKKASEKRSKETTLEALRAFKKINSKEAVYPTIALMNTFDNDVKWEHAENTLESISQAEIFEVYGGHLMWIGPDADGIRKKRTSFLEKLR